MAKLLPAKAHPCGKDSVSCETVALSPSAMGCTIFERAPPMATAFHCFPAAAIVGAANSSFSKVFCRTTRLLKSRQDIGKAQTASAKRKPQDWSAFDLKRETSVIMRGFPASFREEFAGFVGTASRIRGVIKWCKRRRNCI